jgi:hypothetical protein
MNMGIVTTTPVSLLRNSEDRLFTTDFINPADATVWFFYCLFGSIYGSSNAKFG